MQKFLACSLCFQFENTLNYSKDVPIFQFKHLSTDIVFEVWKLDSVMKNRKLFLRTVFNHRGRSFGMLSNLGLVFWFGGQGDICFIWGTADDAERRPCEYCQVGPWSEGVPSHKEGVDACYNCCAFAQKQKLTSSLLLPICTYHYQNVWIIIRLSDWEPLSSDVCIHSTKSLTVSITNKSLNKSDFELFSDGVFKKHFFFVFPLVF